MKESCCRAAIWICLNKLLLVWSQPGLLWWFMALSYPNLVFNNHDVFMFWCYFFPHFSTFILKKKKQRSHHFFVCDWERQIWLFITLETEIMVPLWSGQEISSSLISRWTWNTLVPNNCVYISVFYLYSQSLGNKLPPLWWEVANNVGLHVIRRIPH